MRANLKEIYKQIAEEHGMSADVVEAIVRSQFEFLRTTMGSADSADPSTFKSIQVTHLGKFAVRQKKVSERAKKIQDGEENTGSNQ